jgi:hypothetical protein
MTEIVNRINTVAALDYSNEDNTKIISKITQEDGKIAVERAAAGTLVLGNGYSVAE